jgi:hypothetical protein
MNDLPSLKLNGADYAVPEVEEVHAGLVQTAVESEEDLCIVTPTLRAEYFDYHALAALFADMKACVLVMTPNADVRDRYQSLENGSLPSGQMQFAKTHWPLATVTSKETLSRKTSLTINNRRDRRKPPQFVYCKHSSRLPTGEAAKRVDVVLWDDSVKFEYERWERFVEWRKENDVGTAIYFVRDPTGPVARQVKDEVDTTWAWTPSAISKTISSNAAADGGTIDAVPESTPREEALLKRRANGIDYDLQVQAEGEVAEAFNEAWSSVQAFSDFVDDVGEKDLYPIASAARRAVAGHARLLAQPKYSLKYRAGNHRATPHKTRIDKLARIRDSLSGDAGAAFGPLDDLIDVLRQLRETIEGAQDSSWKRGAIIAALKTVVDREESLIIVCPDGAARKALQSDFLIERSSLWNGAAPYVELHTHRTLSQADPADELLLYGPPKKSQRWLLRSCHAPRVTILAYPHELGLLVSQTTDLNASLEDFTPLEATDPDAVPERTGDHRESSRSYSILDNFDAPSLAPDDVDEGGEDFDEAEPSRTRASPPYDGVSVSVPDEDAVVDFANSAETTSSTRRDGEPNDAGGLGDYQLVDTDDTRSIDDLLDETASTYRREHQGGGTSTGRTSEGTRNTGGRSTGSSSSGTTKVEGLVEVRTEDGYARALKPTDEIEVVDAEAGTTVEKNAAEVRPGEMVVVVHDRQAVRDAVEDHLVEAGHFDLVAQSRMWYERLDVEIERHDDDLQDFIDKVEEEGLNKSRSAYRGYYYGRVNMPRAKETLRTLARAYDMEDVLKNFDDVWDANQTIRNLKDDLIDELKKRLHETLADGDDDEFLNEERDVRLSDFPVRDEQGRPFVERHVIDHVVDDVTRRKSNVGRWRQSSTDE